MCTNIIFTCNATAVIPIYPGQKWHNELGSTMIIESYDTESGVFSGKYKSKVGMAERFYTLTGPRDTDGNTIGWTVNWQNADLNAHAVTTWSGQLQKSPFGDPMILTVFWRPRSEQRRRKRGDPHFHAHHLYTNMARCRL